MKIVLTQSSFFKFLYMIQKDIKAAKKKLHFEYTSYILNGKPFKYIDYAPEDAWGVSRDHKFYYVGFEDDYKEVPTTESLINKKSTKKRKKKKIKVKVNPMDCVKSLNDFDFDPNLFIPLKSNTLMDSIFSAEGGLMPACNYIIVGDPGSGKTTLMAEFLSNLPKDDVLFYNVEMSPADMVGYAKRSKAISEVPTIFLSELYTLTENEPDLWEVLKDICFSGKKVILIDSLKEVIDPIREQKGWTYNSTESRFVRLMVEANAKFRTSFLIIQQVNKGGRFVGSNALKHNTTGMIAIRKESDSRYRKIYVDKNRRGQKYETLRWCFTKEGIIQYDVEDIEIQERVSELLDNSTESIKEFIKLSDMYVNKDDNEVFEEIDGLQSSVTEEVQAEFFERR